MAIGQPHPLGDKVNTRISSDPKVQSVMEKVLKILLLEDSPTDAELITHELKTAGFIFTALRVETQDEFLRAMNEFHPDIILSDYNLPTFDGMTALKLGQRDHPEIPIIMVTGALSDIEAVELINTGARDYVLKDGLARLAPAVQRTLAAEQGKLKRLRAEKALFESETKLKLFRTLLDHSSDAIEVFDPFTLGLVDMNETECLELGYSREELLTMSISDIDRAFRVEPIQSIQEQMQQSGGARFEGVRQRKDGSTFPVEVSSKFVQLDKQYVLNIVRDITERKQAEENLRITASVFNNSKESILITDANNNIVDVNPAFSHITGYSREEVLGKNPKVLSSGRQDKDFYEAMWQALKQQKSWRGEIWNRRKSGETYAELLSISVICDDHDTVQRYVAVFSDISYMKNHEAELNHVANYDALTGIPNRRLLGDRLRQAIARAQHSGRMVVICYLDLDGFKQVNDTYGHEAGDYLLVEVSRRIQESLRACDTLARLGGDEFVVLFNEIVREQECLQVLDRILEVIAIPFIFGNNEMKVSASIGVTFYPYDNEDGDTLLRHADQAMYVAKQTGKNHYHLFDAEHDQRVRSLHESRKRIEQGLQGGEFELFYQPKIELVSGNVMGVEALIRWHHPERGLLLPAEFLPFIEDSDLEIRLGEWVMDTALTQIDIWYREGLIVEVSINISARHLQSPNFVEILERKLARYPDLPRDKLQIEVLETAALEDIPQSAEIIEACRKLGVNFALDDFGTGYSSLAYLCKLSAHTLKIDQSFVRGMLTNEGDRAIVQGIIALAKTFGCKTVAEGMEAPELNHVLNELGCMYGQGFGIAHPMPSAEFLMWHKNRQWATSCVDSEIYPIASLNNCTYYL